MCSCVNSVNIFWTWDSKLVARSIITDIQISDKLKLKEHKIIMHYMNNIVINLMWCKLVNLYLPKLHWKLITVDTWWTFDLLGGDQTVKLYKLELSGCLLKWSVIKINSQCGEVTGIFLECSKVIDTKT